MGTEKDRIIRDKKSWTAERAEIARLIGTQEEKIRALVSNLNTSSKLDYGTGQFEKAEISLSNLIRNVTAGIADRCPDDLYRFEFEISEGAREKKVRGSAELFTRMLENLIGNSVTHNPNGCDIVVSLEPGPKVNSCVLAVSDNGIGASEPLLKELNCRRRQTSGLGEHGIGLRVVKQIAAYHSWKVLFNANPCGGFRTTVLMK